MKFPHLFFLGKRRPTHLGEQGMYAEGASRSRVQQQAKKHKNPKGVEGTRLGKANRQKKDK